MRLRDLYALCQEKNWNDLDEFMSASVSAEGMAMKILATSIFEAHHPDEMMKKNNGLSVWNNLLKDKTFPKLAKNPLKFFDSSYSLVDLWSFICAYEMANNEKDHPYRPGINDKAAAAAIHKFVMDHKDEFIVELAHADFNPEELDLLKKDFAELYTAAFKKQTHVIDPSGP